MTKQTKRSTLSVSFTKNTNYLYDKMMEESEETGLKLSTIVTKALELYYNIK